MSVLMVLVVVLFSCNSKKQNSGKKSIETEETENQIPVGDNSQVSVDWNGVYQGVVPCADCEGIKTQITLNANLTYIKETLYLGENDQVEREEGKFEWGSGGKEITLGNGGQRYLVGENRLFHLDREGNRIQGDLEDKYILQKENDGLTGKYWKLIELNGEPVGEMRKEPFVMFDDEKRVSGNAGCNTFTGSYSFGEGNGIKFSQLAMTRMACPNMGLESKFVKMFDVAGHFSVTAKELILIDDAEKELAKFNPDFFKVGNK